MQEFSAADKELIDHLIDKYRELINERYQYDTLQALEVEVPDSITPDVVEGLRYFFLHSVYPEAKQRHELEAAFATLSGYVNQPSKVFGLIGNMASAIFVFGRHLPRAVKAGIISLESFLAAQRLEGYLLKGAQDENLSIPISQDEFMLCLAAIPQKQMDKFIRDVYQLFQTMTDTVLLEKTIKILHSVIKRMKKRPRTYPPDEIAGIKLGIDILQAGHDLFHQWDDDLKQTVAKEILANEQRFLAQVYGLEEEEWVKDVK